MELITIANLESPDDFYEALIEAHRDLENADSHALNARLVLLLANHIGSLDVLQQALVEARGAAHPVRVGRQRVAAETEPTLPLAASAPDAASTLPLASGKARVSDPFS